MLVFYLSLAENAEQRAQIERLYNDYKGLIFYTAVKVTHDHYLAEDVVHETFLHLIRIIDDIRFDNESELRRFIRLIAHSQAVDYIRHLTKMEVSDPEDLRHLQASKEPEPAELAIDRISFEKIVGKVDTLDTIYRVPLELKILGYKITQIARIMEIPESTVKVRLFRARKLLLEMLEEAPDAER